MNHVLLTQKRLKCNFGSYILAQYKGECLRTTVIIRGVKRSIKISSTITPRYEILKYRPYNKAYIGNCKKSAYNMSNIMYYCGGSKARLLRLERT